MHTIFTSLKDKKLIHILENPSLKNINKCNVKELRLICKDQSIKAIGLKYELINRLIKYIHSDFTEKIWMTCIGKTSGKCYCCWKNTITLDNCHLKFIFKNSTIELDNILPICKICNSQMKNKNFDRYIKENNLPLRRYGKDAPIGKYIKGIIWWQSLTRMWLERRNLYQK